MLFSLVSESSNASPANYMRSGTNDESPLITNKSLALNVTGDPRTEPVEPPKYLYAGRPQSKPNQKV